MDLSCVLTWQQKVFVNQIWSSLPPFLPTRSSGHPRPSSRRPLQVRLPQGPVSSCLQSCNGASFHPRASHRVLLSRRQIVLCGVLGVTAHLGPTCPLSQTLLLLPPYLSPSPKQSFLTLPFTLCGFAGVLIYYEAGSHRIAQAGLTLLILLPHLPKDRDAHPCHWS